MKTIKIKPIKGPVAGLIWLLCKVQGLSGMRGWTSFWHTVYVQPEFKSNMDLLRHEMTHIKQIDELGRIKFLWQYTRESLKVGYRDNKFEVEARAAQQFPVGYSMQWSGFNA